MPFSPYCVFLAHHKPEGFSGYPLRWKAAPQGWELGECALRHGDVRTAEDQDTSVPEFLQRVHEAATALDGWDRRPLEHETEK